MARMRPGRAARCGMAVVGVLIGWSGYALYGDLSVHLPPPLAAGLAVLYLVVCAALAALAIRLHRRD